MNILINNVHVAYIYMLAKTGHRFFVTSPPGRPSWDYRQRPLPPNIVLLDNVMGIVPLIKQNEKLFDCIIMQDTIVQGQDGKPDIADRLIFESFDVPKVMLFHNSFQTQFRSTPQKYWGDIQRLLNEKLKDIPKVFISEMKKKSYGMDGTVILPGIDDKEFGGWNGNNPAIMTSCNNFASRDFMNGFNKSRIVMAGKDYFILGEGEGQQVFARSFDEYLKMLKEMRGYLCLNNPEFEDGYNLSSLEAMLTGMPCFTLNHPTSPIIDGKNGYKTDDLNELNRLLIELSYEKALEMGKEARKTVIDQFPLMEFIDRWNEVIEMP